MELGGSACRSYIPETVPFAAGRWLLVMKKKILVVDDEDSIRQSLEKMLRAEGYDVCVAENGNRAIEKFKEEQVDLLILDIGLPLKDGWAALQWLNGMHPELPVIVITGRWKQGALAEAAGVDVLMEKPLNVPVLLETIQKLLAPLPAGVFRRHQGFLEVSCDTETFRTQLQSRFSTPYSSEIEPKHKK